jgi:hypothetical protein
MVLVWQGAGWHYNPLHLAGNFRSFETITQRSLDGVTPAFNLYKGPAIRQIPLDADTGLGLGYFAVDRDLGSGYSQQWNLAIQRELTPYRQLKLPMPAQRSPGRRARQQPQSADGGPTSGAAWEPAA